MSKLVISIDFELFWGVAASRSLADYRSNVEGEWEAIPRILELFRQFQVRATWATVGMLMCRDYAQWREIRPTFMPGYVRQQMSTYMLDASVKEFPSLFFARPLVEQILGTPGQEVGTHSYSHFYCGEEGATTEQFEADLACARTIAGELGLRFHSFVFPRNQVRTEFLLTLQRAGIRTYRGNPSHWLYRSGHIIPGGLAGRSLRAIDSWIPLSGANRSRPSSCDGLTNVAASLFLRPWSKQLAAFEPLRVHRLKEAMTAAARAGDVFHLWWHAHNFGKHLEHNLATLQHLLRHFEKLRIDYGMNAASMGDFSVAQAK